MRGGRIVVKTLLARAYHHLRFSAGYIAPRGSAAVFCFHGFKDSYYGTNYGQTSKAHLSTILAAIRSKFSIIDLSRLMDLTKFESRSRDQTPLAAITIDDGLSSILGVMDVFKSYSVRPTVFVCPGVIGRDGMFISEAVRLATLLSKVKRVLIPLSKEEVSLVNLRWRIKCANEWIEYFKYVSPDLMQEELNSFFETMEISREEVRRSRFFDPSLEFSQLERLLPYIEVGSHTMHHSYLSALPDDLSNGEIGESKKKIEEELSIECTGLAYPFGDLKSFSSREQNYAQRNGYRFAMSLVPGFVSSASLFSVPRFNLGNGLKILTLHRSAL